MVNGECVENQPPVAVASASSASIIENDSVTLDASSSSDADGTIVSYEWKLGSALLSNEISFTTTTLPIGFNVISLTITDNTGNVAITDISISVSSNPAPVARAGADQTVYYLDSVTFEGSASTDNGEIVSYEWKKGDVLLSNSSTFTKDDFSVGTHNITLSVTDDGGKTSADDIVVTIFDTFTNILPIVENGRIKSSSSSCYNSNCTTTLDIGSDLSFQITNNLNRKFKIIKFKIEKIYNFNTTTNVECDWFENRVECTAKATNYLLYNGGLTIPAFGKGELNNSDSIFVGYTLDAGEIANYWLATYTLTDVTTGETFTNSYKWEGSSFF